MKILYITNMYPDEESPYYGIFVKEQIDILTKKYPIEYDLYYIVGKKSKLNYFKSIGEIHRLIEHNDYDLIHIHHGLSGMFLFRKMKKNIPVIMTLHGGDIQKAQKRYDQIFLTRCALRSVDCAVTLNVPMTETVNGLNVRTEMIPCSVDTNLFSFTSKKEINSIPKVIFPSDKQRVEKNYPLFRQVLSVYREKYRQELQEVELKNMSRQEIVSLFGSADAMLMTSISEGSPQVVKEAMACNLPVVSTKVGDVDYLLEGVAGSLVVDSFIPEKLADALHLSLSSSVDGITGREKLFQLKLDDDSIAERIYGMYLSLTSR